MTHATVTARTDAATQGEARDTRPVFGYVRVSTKEQEVARQKQTIPARLRTLPNGLSQNALELFYDDGISGFTGKPRPGYESMLARIAAGEASALIVDTSSRLTREGIRPALGIFFNLQDVNTRLFTTEGREYPFDLGGIISLIVDAQGDHRYSLTLSHNVKTGKAAKARAGKWANGPVSPGYQKNAAGELEATPDLPLITEMFERFLAGESLTSIARFLTTHLSDDVLRRTKHGRVNRDWVRLLLRNEVYLGVIPHGGNLYESSHPAAVTAETFKKVQRKLARHAAENYRPPRSWPFSGIARCEGCLRAMTLKSVTKPNGSKYAYLRCSNRDCPQHDRVIVSSTFEATVILHLAAIAGSVGNQLALDPEWATTQGACAATRENARAALEEAESRLREMANLVKSRAITTADPDYEAAVTARDDAEAEWERICRAGRSYRESLAALVASIEALADIAPRHATFERMRLDEPMVTHIATGRVLTEHTVERVLEGWLEADPTTRRSVIAGSLERIIVGKDSVVIEYRDSIPVPTTACPAFTGARRGEAAPLREAGWGGCAIATGST
jgi:DNA invertase Pin-like site-specific DNA recombinase